MRGTRLPGRGRARRGDGLARVDGAGLRRALRERLRGGTGLRRRDRRARIRQTGAPAYPGGGPPG